MAEIGDNTGTSYPAGIDTNTSLEVNNATKARAAVPNDLAAAVIAVQTTLGTNPQGTATDVKTRLAKEHNNDGTHPALIPTIASYTKAGLPAAGTAGRLARVTDGIRGIWKDTGTEWVSVTGHADVRDFGVTGDGTTNDAAAIQTAINAAVAAKTYVFLSSPSVAYNLGTTGVTGAAYAVLKGSSGNAAVQLTYSGTGYAVDLTGAGTGLENLYIIASNAAGNGVRFNGVSRKSFLKNVTIEASSTPASVRTGTGLTFRATATDGAFSGDFLMQHTYSLGYLIGIRFDGADTGTNTWTSVTGVHTFIVGPAGPVAGSKGIWMDAETNGVGTYFISGTIEQYAVGIQHDNGGVGLSYFGDMEANTTNYTVGASFNGQFGPNQQNGFFYQDTNASANKWAQEQQVNGVWRSSSYYDRLHTIFTGSGERKKWGVKNGATSEIDGGSPADIFIVNSNGSDTAANSSMALMGHQIAYDTAAPTTGTWAVGDRVFNRTPSVGNPKSWVCTVAGTPGTWVSEGNL